MAEKTKKAPVTTVFVKLKDRGTIFADMRTGVSVTGERVVEFKKTPKVEKAIRSGILVEVSPSEAEKAISAQSKKSTGSPAKAASKASTSKDSETADKGKSDSADKGKTSSKTALD